MESTIEGLVSILVPLGMFALVGVVTYFWLITRHKERMALIERGIDVSSLKSVPRKFPTLKIGITLLGITIGALIGALIQEYVMHRANWLPFGIGMLLGCLALIISYFIERKIEKKDSEERLKLEE